MKNIPLMLLLSLLIWGCQKPAPENPPAADTIHYYEQCLFRPGDFSSANWRIPAICSLPDGTLLITCDRRKYNESDLPEDIDIVSRRSTDNGRTCNDPVTIAQGNGRNPPSLIVGEVEVEDVHIMQGQPVDILFDHVDTEEMAADIKVHAPVSKARLIVDDDCWHLNLCSRSIWQRFAERLYAIEHSLRSGTLHDDAFPVHADAVALLGCHLPVQ